MLEVETKGLYNYLDKKSLIDNLETKYPEYFEKSNIYQLNNYYRVTKENLVNFLSDNIFRFGDLGVTINSLEKDNFSVRTRFSQSSEYSETNGVFFIVKTGADSINGDVRNEYEFNLPMSLVELDELLENNNMTITSKWMRDRILYEYNDFFTISVDINSGYGGVVEIEHILNKEDSEDELVHSIKAEQLNILNNLGLKYLDKNLLSKMFTFYEVFWEDFYNQDKYIWDHPLFMKFMSIG